jgi:hypothetical protein
MMVGGIVMTSLAPIAMFAAMIASLQKSSCQLDDYGGSTSYHSDCSAYDPTIYGSLVGMTVLLGVGIPMIVIGAKREPTPAAAATLSPWVSPSTAGLSLRLKL